MAEHAIVVCTDDDQRLLRELPEQLRLDGYRPHTAQARQQLIWALAERRLARVALEDPDLETYLSARRNLLTAIRTMRRLRELRLGERSTGSWVDMQADPYTLEEVREWSRLRKRYASDW